MCEDDKKKPEDDKVLAANDVDENMVLFVYGNLKIRDVETGEILINKRF